MLIVSQTPHKLNAVSILNAFLSIILLNSDISLYDTLS